MKTRLAASAILVALLVGGTTGCTFLTPQSTAKMYDASDGIGTTVGDIKVNNALLVTDDGQSASLLINLDNMSDFGVQVTIQYENAAKAKVNDSIFVNANTVTSVGAADAAKFVLTGIEAPAGSLFPVFIQYGDVSGKQMWLPVLAPNGEYAGLEPTITPTP